MKLCRATQLHMLALETVSHRDMKLCHRFFFLSKMVKLCHMFILLVDFSCESSKNDEMMNFNIIAQIKRKIELLMS